VLVEEDKLLIHLIDCLILDILIGIPLLLHQGHHLVDDA